MSSFYEKANLQNVWKLYSTVQSWIHFHFIPHANVLSAGCCVEFIVPVCIETPQPASLPPRRWRWSLRNVDVSWWWGGVCSWWLLLSSALSRGGCWWSTNDSLGQRGRGGGVVLVVVGAEIESTLDMCCAVGVVPWHHPTDQCIHHRQLAWHQLRVKCFVFALQKRALVKVTICRFRLKKRGNI